MTTQRTPSNGLEGFKVDYDEARHPYPTARKKVTA
jgi:hypothetical protein